jgi:hypothetical protein
MPEETDSSPNYDDSELEVSYMADERSESISALLQNISELGTIFKDLNVLVVE